MGPPVAAPTHLDSGMVRVRRIYDPATPDDGTRVLVDRLWPRGVRREAAHLDEWAKEVAPSHELRRWFHAGEGRFAEFRERYLAELDGNEALGRLRALTAQGDVTLLTAARNAAENHATVLAEVLRGT